MIYWTKQPTKVELGNTLVKGSKVVGASICQVRGDWVLFATSHEDYPWGKITDDSSGSMLTDKNYPESVQVEHQWEVEGFIPWGYKEEFVSPQMEITGPQADMEVEPELGGSSTHSSMSFDVGSLDNLRPKKVLIPDGPVTTTRFNLLYNWKEGKMIAATCMATAQKEWWSEIKVRDEHGHQVYMQEMDEYQLNVVQACCQIGLKWDGMFKSFKAEVKERWKSEPQLPEYELDASGIGRYCKTSDTYTLEDILTKIKEKGQVDT